MIHLVECFRKVKNKSIYLFCLSLRARSSTREANCVSQKHLSLKPCCNSYIRSLLSRCFTTLEAMRYPVTLHKIHVMEIGRQLAAEDISPFLKSGETFVHISNREHILLGRHEHSPIVSFVSE